jgi:hypothetical protein
MKKVPALKLVKPNGRSKYRDNLKLILKDKNRYKA